MAEPVDISEGYEYQHNATKNQKLNMRNSRKFKIRDIFEHTRAHTFASFFSESISFHRLK